MHIFYIDQVNDIYTIFSSIIHDSYRINGMWLAVESKTFLLSYFELVSWMYHIVFFVLISFLVCFLYISSFLNDFMIAHNKVKSNYLY